MIDALDAGVAQALARAEMSGWEGRSAGMTMSVKRPSRPPPGFLTQRVNHLWR